MFRTDLLSIIRSLNIVYTAIGICHAESLKVTFLADSQHNYVCKQIILLYRQNLLHFLKYFYFYNLLYNI